MTKYTLHYFPVVGRAEPSRIMFKVAGVDYVYKTYLMTEEWPEMKKNASLFPLGQMPVLEVDGKVICQSWAIHRFLAERLGFYGDSNYEKAVIDQIDETIHEIIGSLVPFIYSKLTLEEQKAGITEVLQKEDMKKKMNFLQNTLIRNTDDNGFFVGSKLSISDIALFVMVDLVGPRYDRLLSDYPQLQQLVERVGNIESIRSYLDERK